MIIALAAAALGAFTMAFCAAWFMFGGAWAETVFDVGCALFAFGGLAFLLLAFLDIYRNGPI